MYISGGMLPPAKSEDDHDWRTLRRRADAWSGCGGCTEDAVGG